MLCFRVSKYLPPGFSAATGTVVGESHRREIVSLISAVNQVTPTILLLDYDEVTHVTSSYLKRTVLWLLRSATAFCDPSSGMSVEELGGDFGGILPLPANIFPVVANLTTDIREEIDEVFARRSLAILEALHFDEEAIRGARVLGKPEVSVRDTLIAVAELGDEEVTAKALFGFGGPTGIGITAWGNRLAELNRLRIFDRRKQGKEWVYRPIAKGIEYGGKDLFNKG